ncbi:MAG: EF-hand domain-containing protein [Pseudomonadota bacterium]
MKTTLKPLALVAVTGGIAIGAIAIAADQKFGAADQDGNGVLTMAEVFIAMPKATPEQFEAADTDDDGRLTEDEYIVAVNEGLLPEG